MKILRLHSHSRSLLFGLLIVLFPLVQACSKSQLGKELADSFDTPGDSFVNEKIIKQPQVKDEQIRARAAVPVSKIDKNKNKNKNKKIRQASTSFVPRPYRIIIKLSGANPSAPAETVTKALRKAGISFEVEKIERYDSESAIKVTSSQRRRL